MGHMGYIRAKKTYTDEAPVEQLGLIEGLVIRLFDGHNGHRSLLLRLGGRAHEVNPKSSISLLCLPLPRLRISLLCCFVALSVSSSSLSSLLYYLIVY